MEGDGDDTETLAPKTHFTASNVTLCGAGAVGPDPTFGLALRDRVEGQLLNLVVTRFDTGVDVRGDFGTAGAPNVKLTHSLFFEQNIAANVVGNPTETDNDMGFDENAWFAAGTGNGQTKPGGFGDCQANPPAVAPTAAAAGGTPTFGDTAATYIGAFKDGTDTWMTGAWIDWAAN
jgi:hypothetical protein